MTDQPTTSGTPDGHKLCATSAATPSAGGSTRSSTVLDPDVGQGVADIGRTGHLAKGWSLDEYHPDALHAFRRDAPAPTPAPAAPAEGREALDLARNIVNQVLDGAVEQGGYSLVDTGARQRFNDIADRFVADLLAARQPAAVASAAQVSALADALRAEMYEHGSDGSTFEAVIRAWLGGDYDGPAPVDAGLRARVEVLAAEGEAWGQGVAVDLSRRLREALAETAEPAPSAEDRACDHAESLHGRCTRCGMTWEQQTATRQPAPSAEDQATCACETCVHYRAVNEAASSAEDREALARSLAPEVWWDADLDAVPGVRAARRQALARADAALAWFAARRPAPVDTVRCVQCEARLTAEQVDQVTSVLHAAARLVAVSGMTAPDAIHQAARVIEASAQPAPVDAETTTEWGVRWSEDCVEPHPSAEDAFRATADDDSGTSVQRTVLVLTPWREVQDRG